MSDRNHNRVPERRRPPRLLFVSTENRWRGATAERIYRRDPRVLVRAGGMSSEARQQVTEKDVAWADAVLVMESKHRDRLLRQHRNLKGDNAIVLHIPNEFQYMDPHLVEKLRSTVEPIIDALCGDEH